MLVSIDISSLKVYIVRKYVHEQFGVLDVSFDII